jgi:adenine phosphoribosyltransferase
VAVYIAGKINIYGENNMIKTYPITIGRVRRKLPICPLNETLSIAAFVVVGDPELATECAIELLKIAPEYDIILTAEAKGIPIAHEMARLHGDARYITARKAAKLYMTGVIEVSVRSITTAQEQKLFLDTADAELMRGKRVLIVDDVISTGESLRALERLCERVGGEIVGKMAVLAEGDAAKRADILFVGELPLFEM